VDKDQSVEISFEEALEKLEGIVEQLEGGDTPLAELLERFEEGSRLLKTCEKRLKEAELKIELLRKEKKGVAFEDFDPDAETRAKR
jgi:exodeoxyribonuclease VII small subunit